MSKLADFRVAQLFLSLAEVFETADDFLHECPEPDTEAEKAVRLMCRGLSNGFKQEGNRLASAVNSRIGCGDAAATGGG